MLTLIEATAEKNGIIAKKVVTNGNRNSCELRKISFSGRDNGYIASVNLSGTVVATGQSWRGKIAASPIELSELQKIVSQNWAEIKRIIEDE